jgi:hypothetical protein
MATNTCPHARDNEQRASICGVLLDKKVDESGKRETVNLQVVVVVATGVVKFVWGDLQYEVRVR